MIFLVVDDADWLILLEICLRRLGHQTVCVHFSEVDRIPQLLAATRFDGAIVDWRQVNPQALRDLLVSLAGTKIVWYTDVPWGVPSGYDLVLKGDVVADFLTGLLPLFKSRS